jgi:3',5'-cyclic AMP phosphodiesterase CpdA
LRTWNLRRGDADDNRSCPKGDSLRSLAISAVFEFNYVKAPVAFLSLVIGPALLVGIAPSVVVTYGRLLGHATTLVGPRLPAAIGLLTILLGAAFWFGKPLFTIAFENYLHLHYSLVFPSYIALRELLRSISERLMGRSTSSKQLNRRRRMSMVLAALLLAGGGIVLASAAEVSIGLNLVDVEHVRIWATLKAAFGNAAIIIGLFTVFESLYWLWRELTLAGPVLDWVPRTAQAALPTLRVAHLSDLHIVGERYGCRMESGTEGPRGNRCFRAALRKLAAIHAQTPLDRVLVTGDITDSGTRAEWAEFIDLLRGCRELRARISFVPGNHDVNIVDRTNPARLDLPWSTGQALRKLRFILALEAIQGDRAHLIDRVSRTAGPSLKDYLRTGNRRDRLRELAQSGTMLGRWEMAKTWEAIFPLIEPAPTGDGYGLILLDSNAPSHLSLTNAVGVVNPAQMNTLKSVLENSPDRSWIILLHHQVVEYPELRMARLSDRIGLALVNAPDLLAAIAPYAAHVIIFHGHRHRDWVGTCGDLVLGSAPSVTLGSDDYQGSFHVHDLVLGSGGNIHLASTQRVKVA